MPEPFFADFELIPDEGLNLTPDEEADAYADPDALAPSADDETAPFGRTVWMDWDSKEMREDVWVAGVDAVVQIAQMALNVVRGTCPYLPDWFGVSGPSPLLGQVDDVERRVLHATDIRDTLLSCHERITDVADFRWKGDPDSTALDFEADVEIDGEVVTLVGGTVNVG